MLDTLENKVTGDRRERLLAALLRSPLAQEMESQLDADEIRAQAKIDLAAVEAAIVSQLPRLTAKSRAAGAELAVARARFQAAENAAYLASTAEESRRAALFARRAELQSMSCASENWLRLRGLIV